MQFSRAATFALLGLLAGCNTAETPTGHNPVIPSAATASQLRPGDSLTIAIVGVPDPSTNSVQIDDRGIISLPYIGTLNAAGETTGGLTQRIRDAYVTKKIYMSVDVSVSVTERYVYVGGEVEKPGRIIWTPDPGSRRRSGQAARGSTLYAKEDKVSVVRLSRSSTTSTSSWRRRVPRRTRSSSRATRSRCRGPPSRPPLAAKFGGHLPGEVGQDEVGARPLDRDQGLPPALHEVKPPQPGCGMDLRILAEETGRPRWASPSGVEAPG